MSKAEAGWSKRKITPDISVLLSGYRPTRKSEGKNDDIFVKVLALRVKNQHVVFIMLDLIGVDNSFVALMKKHITDHYGEATQVIVSATHTHSAPVGTLDTSQGLLRNMQTVFGEWDQSFVDFIIQQTLEAVKESEKRMSPCEFRLIDTEIEGVTENRNEKEGYTDNRLFAMEMTDKLNKKALFCHFSCHLTVLNRKNTLVSKDLAYGIERALSDYDFIGFLNGAAGDLSTRFTREESSVEQIKVFGKMIADEIKNALRNVGPIDLSTFEISKHTLNLKTLRSLRSDSQLRADGRTGSSNVQSTQVALGMETHEIIAQNVQNLSSYSINFSYLQINGYHFFTFPGELYSSLLGKEAYDLNLRVMGYTNGYCLYLPDQDAFKASNYEALSSPFRKGEGEKFASYIKKLVMTS